MLIFLVIVKKCILINHFTFITFYNEIDGQVRLVSGNFSLLAGRLEVYHNGIWGTVCDDSFDINDARVVCRQLGFRSVASYDCCGRLGSGTGSILLDDVNCRGDESSINECNHSGWGSHNCAHSEDVGVTCSNGMKSFNILLK